MSIGFDTKLNIKNGKFEQCNNEIISLSGCTQIYGILDIHPNGIIDSCSGYRISGTTMFKASNQTISSLYLGQYAGNDGNGIYNIGIGTYTLTGITLGQQNIGIGLYSLAKVTCGNNNIGIGSYALSRNTCGCNNIAIGPYAGICANSNASNRLYISNCCLCNLIYGEFDNNVVILPKLCLCETPAMGGSNDAMLVWNSTDKCIKQASPDFVGDFTITGDGSATGFTVAHCLNIDHPVVQIVRNTSPYPTIYTDVARINVNCLCIKFDVAPAIGQEYKVLIIR